MTLLIKLNPQNPNEDKLKDAADAIRNGGLVAFPTETVYGLGANALSEEAVKKIFAAKGRPSDNPLIVHVSSLEQVDRIAYLNSSARKLIDSFWPGPLTIIIKKKNIIPDIVTAGLDTVAVRMPEAKIANKLIELSGVPIAAPSANLSTKPSPTRAEHVIEDLFGRVDVIIDGGPCEYGLESTVVDTTSKPLLLLRPGWITLEQLNEVIDVEKYVPKDASKPKSPGMKYRHYAPKAKIIVLDGPYDVFVKKVRELIKYYKKQGKKVGLLITESFDNEADFQMILGKDPGEIAKSLFNSFRMFDANNIDIILAESIAGEGIGLAVKNRLVKASYKVVILKKQ